MDELWLNAGGVAGVGLVLLAYAGIHVDGFDPKRAPALLMNLIGSGLILLSMLRAFNLSAFLMEASWAAVAGFGLLKLLLRRRQRQALRAVPADPATSGIGRTPPPRPRRPSSSG